MNWRKLFDFGFEDMSKDELVRRCRWASISSYVILLIFVLVFFGVRDYTSSVSAGLDRCQDDLWACGCVGNSFSTGEPVFSSGICASRLSFDFNESCFVGGDGFVYCDVDGVSCEDLGGGNND